MTSSEKYTWGVILSIGGSLAFVGGVLLSLTLIGACLGVPMALVGFPLMIWGIVWAYQGHFEKQQEVIRDGIREGIASVQGVNSSPVPSVVMAATGVSDQLPLTNSDILSSSESAAAERTEGYVLPEQALGTDSLSLDITPPEPSLEDDLAQGRNGHTPESES